jgi:AcrR family transcriptional regulator
MSITNDLPRFSPDDRKDRILAAARACFLANGFAGTATRDIATAAGVSEGLLFRHFENKRNLFELSVIEPLQDAVHATIDEVMTFVAMDDRETLVEGESFQLQMLKTFSEIAPLLALALFSERDVGQKFFDHNARPLFDAMTSALEEAMGTISATHVDASLLAGVLYGTYFAYGITRSFGVELAAPEVASQQLTQFFLRGLGVQRQD